jgi:hypothetical protein
MKGTRMPEKKYTQIAVTPTTQKKISILAAVIGPSIYELVESWTNEAWEKAKEDGLVTDAMIQSQEKPSPSEKKTNRTASARVAVAA